MSGSLDLLTTGGLLIAAVFAVSFAIAELRFEDALGAAVVAATWAEELVVRTRNGRAVGLITLVRTVMIAVTVEIVGYAQGIRAAELRMMAGWEVCKGEAGGFRHTLCLANCSLYLLHPCSSELSPQSLR